MASVFTFEPDPREVVSPWLEIDNLSLEGTPTAEDAAIKSSSKLHDGGRGVTKLVAEPQEGSVEYKLHLLLRPRRQLSASSTTLRVPGSYQSSLRRTNRVPDSDIAPPSVVPIPAPTNHSRHNRLQNLTTQLLWRLQQSSPFHSSAKSDLVIPTLFDQSNGNGKPIGPSKLLAGLEESQGALYEIGVSDDGTLVGLPEDELKESLSTLERMAASLGCKVDVVRRMTVGNCRWTDQTSTSPTIAGEPREGLLWVAEAFIAPDSRTYTTDLAPAVSGLDAKNLSGTAAPLDESSIVLKPTQQTEQLRISLTGNTTSGKSSLLGTLSNSTLDNGRGRSRLSLLKHRHEIASGVTSSIVQELIGYHRSGIPPVRNVVNFASANVSSWNEIHNICDSNRLVVLTDSAGHLRYRRTTVRGLMSWAPDWTICCVAADDDKTETGRTKVTMTSKDIASAIGDENNHSKTHLELCLALGLPLIVVITKYDLGSAGLKGMLIKIKGILKAAGRYPHICSFPTANVEYQDLQTIPEEDQLEMKGVVAKIRQLGSATMVPIICTSAVTGAGICKLHALLFQLPLPVTTGHSSVGQAEKHSSSSAESMFQIDEVFDTSQGKTLTLWDGSKIIDGHILSGHLSRGTLRIGDTAAVGPFNRDTYADNSLDLKVHVARSCPSFEASKSSSTNVRRSQRSTSGLLAGQGSPVRESSTEKSTWRVLRVVSLRNLRLPVKELLAGQIGTVGITYGICQRVNNDDCDVPMSVGRIRKGMVLIHGSQDSGIDMLLPYRQFRATFQDDRVTSIAPGSCVVVYIASIRASAKVLSIQRRKGSIPSGEIFDPEDDPDADVARHVDREGEVELCFEFLASTEWFEMGSQVLVMPERADVGDVGLDAFVGKVTAGWVLELQSIATVMGTTSRLTSLQVDLE